MLVFYFFAAIVIWLGVLSFLSGFRFSSYVRRELARPLPDYIPFASIICPCRGLESGLKENIDALFKLQYPEFEIIFVTDHANDPSISLMEEAMAEHAVPASIVIAGEARDSGQKVHNLQRAISTVANKSEVLVFVDSDARPEPNWLRSLVAPLANEQIGAASGYRWFIPEPRGFASQLRSVWNASIASALGEREDKNFCWGGSTAIRRTTFEKLQVNERWRGTVSDDFTLTRVLQEAKLPIHFVPACLVASFGDCDARELLEFTNRQLKITRVYAAHLWLPLLIGSLLFSGVFFGGIVLLIARVLLKLDYLVLLVVLLVIYMLGAAKSFLRLQTVVLPLARYRKQLFRTLPAHLLLWPVASLLYLCNALVAAFSRRINWRGITYELKSATEAVIISRE